MKIRSLLVHVDMEGPSSDARLRLAAGLAKRHDATLIGVAAGAVRPIPMGDAYTGAFADGEIIEAERREIEARLGQAREVFFRHPACADVLTEWRSAVDLPADVIAREARAADLVVVGRDLDRPGAGSSQSADPGDLLMRAGRPLLVVPPGTGRLEARRSRSPGRRRARPAGPCGTPCRCSRRRRRFMWSKSRTRQLSMRRMHGSATWWPTSRATR